MLVATLAALALRLFRLGHASLWIDESLSWLGAGIGRPFGAAEMVENVHGPIYLALLHAWGSAFGESEWALRLPSAVFGAATVPVLAWLSGRWLGRETVVPAAWLAAGSPFLVWYSQEMRNYSLLILAAAVSSAFMLGLRERVRPGPLVGYAVAAVTGALSNFSFAFLAPLHLGWWLSGPGRLRRLAGTGALALVIALAVAPWIPTVARTWDWSRLAPGSGARAGETPLRGATTFHLAGLPYALHTFATGYSLGPTPRELKAETPSAAIRRNLPAVAASAVVFGTLGVLGLAALRRRGRLGDALVWTLPALVLVSWFAFRNFKVFHPRYLAPAFPAFLMTLAAAFADLRPRPRRALAIAVAAVWAVSLAQLWFVPRYGKEDYRGAMARIRERAVPGERLIVAGADHPLTYYNRGLLPERTLWLGFAADLERLDRELDRARDDAGSWVVLSRGEDLDPGRRFARRLGERFPEAERFATEGVEVWRLPPPRP